MATELGLPPGFRFVPTDEELVELWLLPRIQGQPLLPHDIIEDDPLSAPPWALLEKHGRRHQAFFFAACQAMNAKGGRQKRTCEGHGTWQGQGKRKRGKEEDEGQEIKQKLRVRVHGGAEETEIEWDKYALNFHERGVQGSSGWVMHEYSITAPPELARSPVRVYCIRFSGHGRKAKNNSRDAQHRGDDEFDDEEEEVDDEAAGAMAATATCGAAEGVPAAQFFDEYPPPAAQQLEHHASFPVMAADVVINPDPADGAGAGYDQDLDLPGLVDYDDSSIFRNAKKLRKDAQHEFEDEEERVDDAAAAITTNTAWSAAEEDAALLIEEYLTFPLVEVDDSANPADGADAGAGYDQDSPALVENDHFLFMNSLPDLVPDVDFSQWDDLYQDA